MSIRLSEAAAAEDIVADLWRRRLDTLVAGIANGDPYYLQIANAAEQSALSIRVEPRVYFLI